MVPLSWTSSRPSAEPAQDGATFSEAGENPALSRNGDAPRALAHMRGDKPGRLYRVSDLSSEEGRFVPMPPPAS